MVNSPNLTTKQQQIIAKADSKQLEIWMDEIFPAYNSNLYFKQLYEYLNKERLRRDGLKV